MIERVRLGSDSEGQGMSAARPVYPAQRTIAEGSLNVCDGPGADIQTWQRAMTCSDARSH